MCTFGTLFDQAPTDFDVNQANEYITSCYHYFSNDYLSYSFDPNAPNIFSGNFSITDKITSDTFLLPTTITNGYWSKGVAYINQYNLGRYWPVMGPQVTLYAPAPWLKSSASNSLTMVELQSTPCGTQTTCSVELVDYPILDKPTLFEAPILYKRQHRDN